MRSQYKGKCIKSIEWVLGRAKIGTSWKVNDGNDDDGDANDEMIILS